MKSETTPCLPQGRVEEGKQFFLHDAIKDKDINSVKILLKRKFDVNEKNNDGRTAAHIASEMGFSEGLSMLTMEKNIDINVQDNEGKTPLFIACENNRVNCVKLLIEKGADVNKNDYKKSSPAYIALKCGHKDCYRELFKKEAVISSSEDESLSPELKTFHKDILNGNKENVITFLSNEDNEKYIDEVNERNQTAFHLAAQSGNSEILETLLEKSKKLDEQDILSKTPLFLATETSENKKCIELLVKMNASILKRDVLDRTPLQIIPKYYNEEILNILIENFKKQLLKQESCISCQELNSGVENQQQLNCKECEEKLSFDLSLADHYGTTCLDVIFEHSKDPVEILNSIFATKYSAKPKITKERKFTFDFRLLSPGESKYQMRVIHQIFSLATEEEMDQLCNNQLITTFLKLKERQWIFWGILFAELLLLIPYWVFVYLYVIEISLKENKESNLVTISVARTYAISFAGAHIFVGFIKHVSQNWKARKICFYKKFFEILLNFINPVFIIIIAFLEVFSMKHMVSHHLIAWFTSLFSLSICLEPFFILSKFPKTENYFEILFVVLKKFIILLFMFLSIFTGFAVSFHILFHHKTEFMGFWRPILKTLVMMTGDFGYDEMFERPDENNQEFHFKKELDSSITRTIFILFIIIVNIVIGNITIGVAVDDISTLKEKYKKKKMQRQSETLEEIEYFFYWLDTEYGLKFEWIMNKFYVAPLTELDEPKLAGISRKLLKSLGGNVRPKKIKAKTFAEKISYLKGKCILQ